MPDEPKPLTPKRGKPSKRQPTAITIRGSKEWAEWLQRGADHCRTDVSKLIDAASVDYLRARGVTMESLSKAKPCTGTLLVRSRSCSG